VLLPLDAEADIDGGRLNCVGRLLDRTIERLGGDRPCLVGENEVWTYDELRRRSNQVARVLTEDLGVVPGNRVLLRGFNSPWTVACWLGCLRAGAVVVTTVPQLRAAELGSMVEIARPQVVLCDARLLKDLEEAVADTLEEHRPAVTVMDGADSELSRRAALKPDTFDTVPTAADDVALLAFTSGTTGRPKATVHSHSDVIAIAETFSRHVLRPEASDVFTGTPPLGFTFGLGGLLVFPLSVGASVVLLEQGSPDRLVEAIERHRATVVFTAPTAYRAMLPKIAEHDVSSLRRCVSAGEPLPVTTRRSFAEATGQDIIEGIGSTELLHIFIAAADGDIREGATGKVVKGFEARVVDDQGHPVPDGVLGRLAVRGPTGCRYLADERQRDYVRDGWNLTGDLYTRDEDGYFWYWSRSDDLIVSSGYKIAPIEVENALLAHPDVLEAAVVGVPDTERGSLVTAHVVLAVTADPGPATARALQDFVKDRIAPYKYPRQVVFSDRLPKTNTGKLTRYRLREDSAGSTDRRENEVAEHVR
jgi:2-aminobenzoate-CoA ligase